MPGSTSEPKAAIVDQLYSLHPNPTFVDEMTGLLEECGFRVDIYQGKQIDVEFYRELPEHGYQVIIPRAHSGLMAQRETPDVLAERTTYLFTDEVYSERKYVLEQVNDQMVSAEMAKDYPRVFAVNARFIMKSMNDRFNNTAMIMMGCSTLCLEDIAAAFSLQGASTYVGWDRFVSIDHVDEATIYLVEKLLVDEFTVEKAVAATMAEKGHDPVFDAILKYYPQERGAHTIQELITGKADRVGE